MRMEFQADHDAVVGFSPVFKDVAELGLVNLNIICKLLFFAR